MQQAITGFHEDADGHWVAELACGHNQHVRHNPPWIDRPWVVKQSTRLAQLGALLDCIICDENARKANGEDIK